MKYKRKFICCNRLATRRVGRRDFCETCFKEVHKVRARELYLLR